MVSTSSMVLWLEDWYDKPKKMGSILTGIEQNPSMVEISQSINVLFLNMKPGTSKVYVVESPMPTFFSK